MLSPFACICKGQDNQRSISPPFGKGRRPATAKPLRRRQGEGFYEAFSKALEKVFGNTEGDGAGVGHIDFWVKGGTASGLNTGALSKINNEMVKALHKLTNIQEKEIEA